MRVLWVSICVGECIYEFLFVCLKVVYMGGCLYAWLFIWYVLLDGAVGCLCRWGMSGGWSCAVSSSKTW